MHKTAAGDLCGASRRARSDADLLANTFENWGSDDTVLRLLDDVDSVSIENLFAGDGAIDITVAVRIKPTDFPRFYTRLGQMGHQRGWLTDKP
ncbi:hypothetical protein [Amycolatopsis sp. CA-230715]|uniref:hypothetical protein n=1 Tax=Amycolatopsis sp. CA-230715 TaxID=2745196 RepID=UPI001C02D354|nr:hypothetical protein [Amycolatopsis sp. CA-230715]